MAKAWKTERMVCLLDKNKTNMRNIHPRMTHFLFSFLRVWIRVGFRARIWVGIRFRSELLKKLNLLSYCYSNTRSIHSTLIGYYKNQRWIPRGHIFKSLALASKPCVLENCPVLDSRTALFFEPLKFCWKTPETSRKICKYLFCFPQLEHRRSQAGLSPQLIFHWWQKCDKKAYCFFSFSFFLAFFADNSITN